VSRKGKASYRWGEQKSLQQKKRASLIDGNQTGKTVGKKKTIHLSRQETRKRINANKGGKKGSEKGWRRFETKKTIKWRREEGPGRGVVQNSRNQPQQTNTQKLGNIKEKDGGQQKMDRKTGNKNIQAGPRGGRGSKKRSD